MEESHKIDDEREILECLFNQIELFDYTHTRRERNTITFMDCVVYSMMIGAFWMAWIWVTWVLDTYLRWNNTSNKMPERENRKKIPISIFVKHMDIYVRYCLLFFICCFPFFLPFLCRSPSLKSFSVCFFLSSFVSSGLLFSLIRHRRQRQQHHHYFNAFIDSVSIPIIVGIFH